MPRGWRHNVPIAKAHGFTLTEVVVATVIVALLSALLFPVFAKAKDRANEAHCVSNFRQIHLALSAYRTAWEGIDAPAPSDQMGFPPRIYEAVVKDPENIKEYTGGVFLCRGRGYKSDAPAGYWQGWAPGRGSPLWSQGNEDDWIRHVTVMGQGSIVQFDPSHQLFRPVTPLSTQRALGLRMDGSVRWRLRRGKFKERTWWEDPPVR